MDSNLVTHAPAGAVHIDAPLAARTVRHPIDMDILPELLGYNVRCAQLALQRSFTRTMGGTDIGAGVFGLLVLAGANPGIAQIQVATHLNVDKASVVSMVDRLEEQGWMVRRRALDDRRRHGLFLTADLEARLARVGARKGDASDADAAIARAQEHYVLGALDWREVDASGTPEETLRRAREALRSK